MRDTATPDELTGLIGREATLRRLGTMLNQPEVRHLTLSGPGGIGKTRLARRAADLVAPDFPDGITRVDLAPLADPALVPGAIAAALGLALDRGRPAADVLVGYFQDRAQLLLLDNFEHLLDAAPLVPHLIGHCPELVVLVTSRERLGTAGEQVEPVLSLPLPGDGASLAGVAASPAVQLFVARATAVRPEFHLTGANTAAVATICRRLDGIPLALELAAARIAHFSPTLLAEHVGQLLPLLAGGHDRPRRQQTMQAAIAWSYDLLDDAEQRLFARLAVAAGGCTLPAAVVVGGMVTAAGAPDELATMLGIGSLVDKSLLRFGLARDDGEPRYAMLEPIREFGLGALSELNDDSTTRQALAEYLLDFTARMRLEYRDTDPGAWIVRLEPELDNIRVSLRWLVTGDHDQQRLALRLCNEVSHFWLLVGQPLESRSWLEQITSLLTEDRTIEMAGAYLLLGNLYVSEPRRALAAYQRSLELFQALDSQWGIVGLSLSVAKTYLELGNYTDALSHLQQIDPANATLADPLNAALITYFTGMAHFQTGQLSEAQVMLDEARSLAERLGDIELVVHSLVALARIYGRLGQLTPARDLLTWSLDRLKSAGIELGQSNVRCALGEVEAASGNVTEAIHEFRSALSLQADMSDIDQTTANAILGLAQIAGASSVAAQAVEALAAVDTWENKTGFGVAEHVRRARRETMERARTTLTNEQMTQAQERGRRWSISEAANLLLQAIDTLRELPPLDRQVVLTKQALNQFHLTRQERAVLCLIAVGHSNQDIADSLSISLRTAANHVTNILGKLDVSNRTQAAALAAKHGLCA